MKMHCANATVLCSGSRTYTNQQLVLKCLREIQKIFTTISIIVGDARGLDAIVRKISQDQNITCDVFGADWNRYQKYAGIKRNSDMIEKLLRSSDVKIVLCFFEGKDVSEMSRGTKHVYQSSIELIRRKTDINLFLINSSEIIESYIQNQVLKKLMSML